MRHLRVSPLVQPPGSAFAGFRFPPKIILITVRWYLRYGLSYRDLEELLAERGIEVDHVTLFRWVQRFTPLLVDVAGNVAATAVLERLSTISQGLWMFVPPPTSLIAVDLTVEER